MKQIALITGASTGIGREFAKIHAAKGGDLIIIARNEPKLLELKTELENNFNTKVLVIAKDLSHSIAAMEIFEQTQKEGLEIEYLINNAGFGGRGNFHERKLEDELQMINLNISALVSLTHLYLPQMIKRNSGRILNVSSTASLMPGPLQAVYFATKAFVTSFSNAINEELSDTGITVTALLPAATETEFAKTAGLDKTSLFTGDIASPEIVAMKGYEAMLKGRLNVIAGASLFMRMQIAGIPFSPKRLIMKITKYYQKEN